MIFAAGLGTRLRPLTLNKPKALVEVGGHALLELAIRRLKAAGIRQFVVNIHHFADQIEAFLHEHQNFGCEIALSDERERLLDTGGGLWKARRHFDADFLVYNVDVLSDIDLIALQQHHRKTKALATLAVRDRPSSRHLLFSREGRLVGWRHDRTGEERRCRPESAAATLAFSGIHIINPALFDFMPDGPAVFSIIDTYLTAGRTERIMGYRHDQDHWLDVGKLPALRQAEDLLPLLPMD